MSINGENPQAAIARALAFADDLIAQARGQRKTFPENDTEAIIETIIDVGQAIAAAILLAGFSHE